VNSPADLPFKTTIDVELAMEEYLDRRDWRINANANQGYSLGGLILNVAGKVTANYWLSHVFSPEAGIFMTWTCCQVTVPAGL